MSKSVINYSKGAVIVMEGAQNPGFVYIIKSGEVYIDSFVKFQTKELNKYTAGDTFGYISALTKNPHGSTLTAITDCIIIKLSLDSFFEYLKQNKSVFLKIISYNTEKLRALVNNISEQKKEFIASEEKPELLYKSALEYLKIADEKTACFSLYKYIHSQFKLEKDPLIVEEAKKLLNKTSPAYSLPEYKNYMDESDYALKKGDIIFVEFEPDDNSFYVVKKGSVKISKIVEEHEFILGIIGKEEIFGEMAIINNRLRTATTTAFEDTVIQKLMAENILEKANDEILLKLFHILSRRIWYAFQRVYMLRVTDPNVRLYLQLQMLISDEIAKMDAVTQEKHIFRFSLRELLKMIGYTDIQSSKITEFLTDSNLSFRDGNLVVRDRTELDHKVDLIKKRLARQFKEIVV